MNNRGWGMADLFWILGVIGVTLVLVSVLIRVTLKDLAPTSNNVSSQIEVTKPTETPEEAHKDDENVQVEINDSESYEEMEELLKSAAEKYVSKYYQDDSVTSVTISLEELEKEALISSLYDPNDNSIICDGYVIYNRESNSYTPYLKCGNNYQTN